MSTVLTVTWAVAIGVCLLGILFWSLAESSLLSVSKSKMRSLSRRGDRRARAIVRVTENADFLSVGIVAVNALTLIIATLMTLLVRNVYGEDAQWHKTVAHLLMLVGILIVGELWPKTYGSLRSERTARSVAGMVLWLTRVLSPMVLVMTAISNTVLRLVGISPQHRRHFITAEEIAAAADMGEEEGALEPEEGEILDSVIELPERTVRDIMVPRVDIVGVPEEASLEEVADVAATSGFSRIPVYSETIDRITGIVYVNDLMVRLSRRDGDVKLTALAREPLRVPETKRLDEMLRELRGKRVHIAVVIDEFGGTAGLVTIEDILEELVGEIEDEHDLPEEDIVLLNKWEAVVSGKARVEDVNEALGTELATDAHDTISGFVLGKAGRVPQEGEVLADGDVHFVVEESNDQHVNRVRVIVPEPQEADE